MSEPASHSPSVEKKHKDAGTLAVDALEISTYAASAVAGVGTTWAKTGEDFFKNMQAAKVFKDLDETRAEGYRRVFEKTAKAEARPQLRKLEAEYSKAVDAMLKSKGINNIWDKFKSLRTHQKWEAALAGLTLGTVAFGGAIMLGRTRHTSETLTEQQQQLIHDVQEKTNGNHAENALVR